MKLARGGALREATDIYLCLLWRCRTATDSRSQVSWVEGEGKMSGGGERGSQITP